MEGDDGHQAGESETVWRPPQPVGETRPPRGTLRGRILAEYRGVFSTGESFTPLEDPTDVVRGDILQTARRVDSDGHHSVFLVDPAPTNLPGAAVDSIESPDLAWLNTGVLSQLASDG
jgi:hypothetical protein